MFRFHLAVTLISLLHCTPVLAETLTLANGDTLTGTLVEQKDGHLLFDHPTLGRLTLQTAQLVQPVVATSAQSGVPKTTLETRIEAGLNGARGNSHTTKYRLGFDRRRETAALRRHFRAAYHKASSDGQTDENELSAELTRDWLLPDSPWFRFARARYDWDEFEDWDSRIGAAGGMGYQFYDRERFELAGRFGLGASQTFGGSDDGLEPEGLLGLESRWQINPTQRLEFDTTAYPRLDDLGEFRNISTLDWLIEIDQNNGLRLKLGIKNEYESDPGGTSSSNDLKYDLSLQWLL
ncbi:MAG: DUF481 domain-containing protein [Gammaproteobacteria bacterium]|nr:DUF481 domain-containing protein [Gammaproteobacteria bacterium]